MEHTVHAIADEALGNTSWLVMVGDGEAVVIDPRRDVGGYIALASSLGARIVAVLETHIHADFVSGARELSRMHGAKVIAARAAHQEAVDVEVADGDPVRFGDVTFITLETPGHTPEHVSYLMTVDGEPRGLFSGGSLIVGGAARTDLTGEERTDELARAQVASVRRIAGLGDDIALHPTHGAGSFCSTGSGQNEPGTIGDERRTNPLLLAATDEDAVAKLISGFGSYPTYFAHLPHVNRAGALLLADLEPPHALQPRAVAALMSEGVALIDARPIELWAREHPRDAISIQARPEFASWLGWVLPYNHPFILLIEEDQREAMTTLARRIGYDRTLGWIEGGIDAWRAAGLPVATADVLDPDEAKDRSALMLDIRQDDEWRRSRIPGAHHIELGDLIAGARPDATAVITYCGHGERSATAASLLERSGVRASYMRGGIGAWEAANLPIER